MLENTTKRPQVSDEKWSHELYVIAEQIRFRLDQKGHGAFSSIHEAYGVMAEEWEELKQELPNGKDCPAVRAELYDLAVAIVFTLASLEYMEW